MASESFFGRHEAVFVYVPNLIGYLRVFCTLLALCCASTRPALCITAYFFGFVCDDLDGRFARLFNQTSKVGAVLDMVTDRISTSGLLVILGGLYPHWSFTCAALCMLDISSHWFQMVATSTLGANSHKDTNSQSWLIRLYYRQRIFMGVCCISCEILYLSVYLLRWDAYWQWPCFHLPLPASLLNLSGLKSSDPIPLALITAAASIPWFTLKQIINVVQLKAAMLQLVQYDIQQLKAS
ncbi:hypothetical protein WJX74_001461 [Apatococcus lobatus]|uniref:CDP-diacylglycerol--inositol 3-phosphatidyltransferase n=1 Tax=Apatococcus lobatus TaxID=904363 RepID=A0AAW1QB79_9CHLO